MKLHEMIDRQVMLDYSSKLKEDRVALDRIRQRIDELDAFVLGQLTPIPKGLPKMLGTRHMMEKNREERLSLELGVINRAFKRADATRKILYMPAYENIERPRDKFMLATEDENLARRYAKGGQIVEVRPGAVTLDFDKQVGSPDGQEHHLFKRLQGFKIVDEDRKTITVRPI